MASLLGVNTGICSGRVDNGDDRPAKLFGHPHDTQCLSITFRFRHRKITVPAFVNVAALLLADNSDVNAVYLGESGDHGRIVRKSPIAVYLDEIREHLFKEIHRVWPIRVPCCLHSFKCSSCHNKYINPNVRFRHSSAKQAAADSPTRVSVRFGLLYDMQQHFPYDMRPMILNGSNQFGTL